MQYKVPQNVDIEDKVIAGLTLRQFMFLMIAGALILVIKVTLPVALSGLFIPLALPTALIGVALAFVKVNERPLEVYIISAAKSLIKPSKRVWLKEVDVDINEVVPQNEPEKVTEKENFTEVRSNLQKLATLVDSGSQNLSGGRVTNVKTLNNSDDNVDDILHKTEIKSDKLEKFIKGAKSQTPIVTTEEKTISSLSSVTPDKSKFEYENLGLANENDLNEMLTKAKEKQKEKEEVLNNAKIIKH